MPSGGVTSYSWGATQLVLAVGTSLLHTGNAESPLQTPCNHEGLLDHPFTQPLSNSCKELLKGNTQLSKQNIHKFGAKAVPITVPVWV